MKTLIKQIFYSKSYHKKTNYDNFENWIINKTNFVELYNIYIDSGKQKYLKPTITKDYRITTMQETMSNPNKRKVYQYNKGNQLINEYKSTLEAALNTGIKQPNIYNACKGKLKSAGGYIWSFA